MEGVVPARVEECLLSGLLLLILVPFAFSCEDPLSRGGKMNVTLV